MEPPLAKDLGFKHNSQTSRIYSLLYTARTMSGLKVPLGVILDFCPTTNHRARMCKIRDRLADPKIVARFGNWTVPPATVNGNDSWYWLERMETQPIQ